jgi:putative hydrolase of the HAD superfamily
MIKNIVFDFGDVFINLNKQGTLQALQAHSGNAKVFTESLKNAAIQYETGTLTTEKFTRIYSDHFHISNREFVAMWNAILLDFPPHRMAFLKLLKSSGKYRLFLLSNTNELHISWIQSRWGINLYEEFKNQFEQFYLSHEIKMRKPNKEIYEFVLEENDLKPEETLFVDDTKSNIDTASELGIHTWNLDPQKDDISNLLERKEFEI